MSLRLGQTFVGLRRCLRSTQRWSLAEATPRLGVVGGNEGIDVLAEFLALLPTWSLRKVVAALQVLRGVALLSATTLMAEIGDFRRFANPRELMAWLGLMPRGHSSGATTVSIGVQL
jgi:transposase